MSSISKIAGILQNAIYKMNQWTKELNMVGHWWCHNLLQPIWTILLFPNYVIMLVIKCGQLLLLNHLPLHFPQLSTAFRFVYKIFYLFVYKKNMWIGAGGGGGSVVVWKLFAWFCCGMKYLEKVHSSIFAPIRLLLYLKNLIQFNLQMKFISSKLHVRRSPLIHISKGNWYLRQSGFSFSFSVPCVREIEKVKKCKNVTRF